MIFFMLSWRCLLKAQPLLSWFCRLTPGCHAGLYLAVMVVMVTHGCHAGLYLAVMVVMVTPGCHAGYYFAIMVVMVLLVVMLVYTLLSWLDWERDDRMDQRLRFTLSSFLQESKTNKTHSL